MSEDFVVWKGDLQKKASMFRRIFVYLFKIFR